MTNYTCNPYWPQLVHFSITDQLIFINMDNQIVLGYWLIRGRGQVARLLLHYTGANWNEKKYTAREQWFEADKKNLGMGFPNLPYLIDGQLKISESLGIQRYIINRSEKKELLGKDLKDQAKVDNLIGVFQDVQKAVSKVYFSEKYEADKQAAIGKIKDKLGLMNKFYGDKSFALGYLTLVDFILAEYSYYIRALDADFYGQFPFLERVKKSIEALPQIKSYYEKENCVKEPFMPPHSILQPVLD